MLNLNKKMKLLNKLWMSIKFVLKMNKINFLINWMRKILMKHLRQSNLKNLIFHLQKIKQVGYRDINKNKH